MVTIDDLEGDLPTGGRFKHLKQPSYKCSPYYQYPRDQLESQENKEKWRKTTRINTARIIRGFRKIKRKHSAMLYLEYVHLMEFHEFVKPERAEEMRKRYHGTFGDGVPEPFSQKRCNLIAKNMRDWHLRLLIKNWKAELK